jgi:protein-tyrosine kinase
VSLVEKALRKMQTASPAASELESAPARRSTPDPLAEITKQEIAKAASGVHASPIPHSLPSQRSDSVLKIDFNALRGFGLMPSLDRERRLTAEYRQIKRPLMAAIRGKGTPPIANGRIIVIASALAGEGKTFTSVNLAMSMAMEKDTSVLLVDGDLAKSHISRTFGVKDEPGLMDLLLDETLDTASVVLPTTVRGLSVLPAGRESTTATEHLGSARMEQIMAELLGRDPKRIVLFDSPPLLLTSESRALTSLAGQIVVVVRAEETTHKAVLDALATIGEGKPVGLVLNQCEANSSDFYYGYGEYGQSESDAGVDRQ